jgi:hypothetical protein
MTGIGKPVKSPACDVLFSVFFKRYTMKLDLSAGTHYSVLRVPIWQDEWLNRVHSSNPVFRDVI